jgi:hypothetical protein
VKEKSIRKEWQHRFADGDAPFVIRFRGAAQRQDGGVCNPHCFLENKTLSTLVAGRNPPFCGEGRKEQA